MIALLLQERRPASNPGWMQGLNGVRPKCLGSLVTIKPAPSEGNLEQHEPFSALSISPESTVQTSASAGSAARVHHRQTQQRQGKPEFFHGRMDDDGPGPRQREPKGQGSGPVAPASRPFPGFVLPLLLAMSHRLERAQERRKV